MAKEENKAEDCTLVLVNHGPGIQGGCALCLKILSTGTWAVGVKVAGHKYLVGQNPKPTCCGEEKSLVAAFGTQREAESLRDDVFEYLNNQGTTEGLVLLEPHVQVSQSIH